MKNIKALIIAMTCIGGLSLYSCKDNPTDDMIQSNRQLKVVSVTGTTFKATGGENTITVDHPIASAYANVDWATVKADKGTNSVLVTAATNDSKQSRHATVVVKSSPADSVIVNIDQYGFVFSTSLPLNLLLSDKAQAQTYTMQVDATPTVASTADWLKATVNGDKLSLEATENATGHPRNATVTITTSNGSTYTSNVTQAEFNKDIAGEYYLLDGDSLAAGITYGAMVDFRENKTGAKELYFPQLALSLSVAWNDATSTLTMAGGTPMGPYAMGKTTYYLFADMIATDGYVYWDNSVTYSATIAYDENSKATIGEFKDDGTIDASTQVNGFSIDAFKDNEASNDNYAGGLQSFGNPILIKADEESGAKSLRRSAKAFHKAPLKLAKRRLVK